MANPGTLEQRQQIVKCINDGNVQKVSSATISKKNDSR